MRPCQAFAALIDDLGVHSGMCSEYLKNRQALGRARSRAFHVWQK